MREDGGGRANLRDHLANERTFLAWVRTAVTLIALGFVVAKFGILLREIGGGRAPVPALTARAGAFVGVALVAGGCVTALLATAKFLRLRREIERGTIAYSPALDIALGAIIFVASIVLAVYIVVTT
ncbi:MAG TPA: DUF202 domain-containing protein [Thermomicrobiaceae bacterium]|nr:DUF202 domain-containing protein [Thermomicrobiaceae bacterium]